MNEVSHLPTENYIYDFWWATFRDRKGLRFAVARWLAKRLYFVARAISALHAYGREEVRHSLTRVEEEA